MKPMEQSISVKSINVMGIVLQLQNTNVMDTMKLIVLVIGNFSRYASISSADKGSPVIEALSNPTSPS